MSKPRHAVNTVNLQPLKRQAQLDSYPDLEWSAESRPPASAAPCDRAGAGDKEEAMKPTEWQRDPKNVKTEKVQFWQNGVMITAQMTCGQARKMVEVGIAYVISAQAIGDLDNDGNRRG